MDDYITRIEAALEDGPTPGPWAVRPAIVMDHSVARVNVLEVVPPAGVEFAHDFVDAAFIAACNPAAIRALLDRLKAAEAENERLREFERSAALTLPGVYYMDPPDGGDVSLLKQLQRMSNDAARYRLLRRKFAIISDGEGNAEFCPINLPRPTYIAPNTAIELDTALDRERLGMDGAERPPTPVGWSDTDWIKHLQEQDGQPHPLAERTPTKPNTTQRGA